MEKKAVNKLELADDVDRWGAAPCDLWITSLPCTCLRASPLNLPQDLTLSSFFPFFLPDDVSSVVARARLISVITILLACFIVCARDGMLCCSRLKIWITRRLSSKYGLWGDTCKNRTLRNKDLFKHSNSEEMILVKPGWLTSTLFSLCFLSFLCVYYIYAPFLVKEDFNPENKVVFSKYG